jgi:hypothetical protein
MVILGLVNKETKMELPNDVDNLRRCANIIEGFWALSPEYRELILSKISVKTENSVDTSLIKKRYLETRDKIYAIKSLRDMFFNPLTNETMGLKEAKDMVESWR